LQLDCPINEVDGDSVCDGIAAGAAEAADGFGLQLQRLVTDGADEPSKVFCGECSCRHVSILGSIDRRLQATGENGWKYRKALAPRANRRSFDCASRDKTARGSAQDDNFPIHQVPAPIYRSILPSCARVVGSGAIP